MSFMAADRASSVWRSGRAGSRGTGACLRGEPALDQPVDHREQHAQVIALRTDVVLPHERRVEARHVGLHDSLGHAGGEEVERRARVQGAVARFVGGQRLPFAQVGAHQQWVDDPCGGPSVGDALVATRRHAR
jgi:hypothetical protein